MADYSGKQFELDFKKSADLYPSISIDRFYDNMGGYAGVKNISDFVAYRLPFQYYFELKAHKGNTLPFSCITDNQWNGLLWKSDKMGVEAGILVHYSDHDETYYVSIKTLQERKKMGDVSLHINFARQHCCLVEGKKKIKTFTYNIDKLLDDIAPMTIEGAIYWLMNKSASQK